MEFFADHVEGGAIIAINPNQVFYARRVRSAIDVYSDYGAMVTVFPLEGETIDEAWIRLTKKRDDPKR